MKENNDKDCDFIETIVEEFLSKLCHGCIEEICNSSLKNVLKLKIESPEKRVNYYLAFLKESIINIETYKCRGKYFDSDDLDEQHESHKCECSECTHKHGTECRACQNLMTINEYKKITSMLSLNDNTYDDEEKKNINKRKRKKKN